MSILIKGMDLPSGCGRCPCSSYGDCDAKQRKRLTGEFRYSPDKRPDWCPMIEISPHGRLIDAGDVNDLIDAKGIEFLSKERHENCHVYEIGYRHGIEAAKAAIANSLTIIEAEGEK